MGVIQCKYKPAEADEENFYKGNDTQGSEMNNRPKKLVYHSEYQPSSLNPNGIKDKCFINIQNENESEVAKDCLKEEELLEDCNFIQKERIKTSSTVDFNNFFYEKGGVIVSDFDSKEETSNNDLKEEQMAVDLAFLRESQPKLAINKSGLYFSGIAGSGNGNNESKESTDKAWTIRNKCSQNRKIEADESNQSREHQPISEFIQESNYESDIDIKLKPKKKIPVEINGEYIEDEEEYLSPKFLDNSNKYFNDGSGINNYFKKSILKDEMKAKVLSINTGITGNVNNADLSNDSSRTKDTRYHTKRVNCKEESFDNKTVRSSFVTSEAPYEKAINKQGKASSTSNLPLSKTSNHKKHGSISYTINNNTKAMEVIKEYSTTTNFKENWKKLKVYDIISEKKIMNSSCNDVMLQGQLSKYTVNPNNRSNLHFQHFSLKFCILTKNYFGYYRSKEDFLTIQNPLFQIPNTNIHSVNRFFFPSNIPTNKVKVKDQQYHCLVLYYYDDLTENSQLGTQTGEVYTNRKRDCYDDVKKIALKFPDKDSSSSFNTSRILQTKRNKNLIETKQLILGSTDESLIDKWVCVINFFINNAGD